METLGSRLKRIRKEKELTLLDVENRINASRSAISYWENDANEPKISNLIDLSNLYQVSLGYLLGMEDELGNPIKEQDLAPAAPPTVPKTTKVTMAAKSKGNKVKNLTIELTEEQLAAFLRKLEE